MRRALTSPKYESTQARLHSWVNLHDNTTHPVSLMCRAVLCSTRSTVCCLSVHSHEALERPQQSHVVLEHLRRRIVLPY